MTQEGKKKKNHELCCVSNVTNASNLPIASSVNNRPAASNLSKDPVAFNREPIYVLAGFWWCQYRMQPPKYPCSSQISHLNHQTFFGHWSWSSSTHRLNPELGSDLLCNRSKKIMWLTSLNSPKSKEKTPKKNPRTVFVDLPWSVASQELSSFIFVCFCRLYNS